jgi:hypothetical protein
MAKGKKRHKNTGMCNKVLVIGPFANEKHLKIYQDVIGKYGIRDAGRLAVDLADSDDMDTQTSLEILDIELRGLGASPEINVEEIKERK